MFSVRGLLSGSIRLQILNGIMLELLFGDYGSAQEAYSRALALINLARSNWPGKAEPDLAGSSLRRTFSGLTSYTSF